MKTACVKLGLGATTIITIKVCTSLVKVKLCLSNATKSWNYACIRW